MPSDDPKLLRLRDAIDQVDRQLLTLFAERMRLVLEVGEFKRTQNLSVYDPQRERAMLERIERSAPPPLEGKMARRLFEHVIREFRSKEQDSVSSYPPRAGARND